MLLPIDSRTFWRDDQPPHPPLTSAMIEAAERSLGIQLPPALLALLRAQNGGYTAGFVYPMAQPTSWAPDHIPLAELFGIVPDPTIRTAQNLLDTPYLTTEWDLPPRQVLLAGDGHTWLALDYRAGPVPGVVWLEADDQLVVPVAPSFDAFLAGLLPADEFGE